MRTALAAVLALLVLPAASAIVPPVLEEGTEVVSMQSRVMGVYDTCTSRDPLLGMVSTDLTSRITHVVEGSQTRYTLRLDAVATNPMCPAVDISFLSGAAWPTTVGGSAFAFAHAECGASGYVYTDRSDNGVSFIAAWNFVPGSCGWSIPGSTTLFAWIQHTQPSETLLCSPIVYDACTGAIERSRPAPFCDDEMLEVHAAGVLLVEGRHGCAFWTDGHEYATFGDGFGLVMIHATEEACTLRVDAILDRVEAACPTELGALVYGADWHGVLP